MENEFVSYGQAVALKELRFNEPCLGYYTHNTGVEMNKLALTRNPKRNINSDIDWVNKLYEGDATAPLKQQVFRWFREKYNLPNHIDAYWQHDWNDYSYQWSITENHEAWTSMEHYKTYEEAENACIDKLIETTKQ